MGSRAIKMLGWVPAWCAAALVAAAAAPADDPAGAGPAKRRPGPLLNLPVGLAAPAAPPEGTALFEKEVLPLLAAQCGACHGAKLQQAGVRLDTAAGLVKKTDGGKPLLVPGHPEKSLLIQVMRHDGEVRMPPAGKLPPAAIEVLTRWVRMGASGAASVAAPQVETSAPAASRQKHWSFRPVRRPALPRVKDRAWARNPVDAFVLARLEVKGLRPNPPADPRTLIRRATFDLTGLPPTPEEVEAFVRECEADQRGEGSVQNPKRQRGAAAVLGTQVRDTGAPLPHGRDSVPGTQTPSAYERLIDRLLASPHYGERWGRHWLDVARYSDGSGGFLDPEPLPGAYRYRDWVVDALNRDMPYDEFVRRQIAGDLLSPAEPIATGFFALGPTYRDDGGDPDSVAQAKSATLDDRLDTLTRGFLGLTVSCARCHDHKFDPVPTLDYYSLAGIFNNTTIAEQPMAPPEVVEAFHAAQKPILALEKALKDRRSQLKKADRAPTADEARELAEQERTLEQLKKAAPPPFPVAHVLADTGSQDMPVALRGNMRKPGEMAPRRFLRVVAGDDPPRFTQGSGRRELAEAVASPANPLTARVIVNRIWLGHFGEGLVRTPSNFGILGEPPTHPELLDWLASSFVSGEAPAGEYGSVGVGKYGSRRPRSQSGHSHTPTPPHSHTAANPWSLKSLHRLLMLSSTYRQSSVLDGGKFALDGENRLLWRMKPRRLEVEAWRDALLAVSGELDRTVGGPPPDARLGGKRRTLYAAITRSGDQSQTDEFLRLFDFPSPRTTSEQRTTTVVPQQYLFMLNNPFMVERAGALAKRLAAEGATDAERIRRAYLLLYARPPEPAELQLGLAALAEPDGGGSDPSLSPWQRYAQVLLSANEFLYLR